MLIEVPKSEQHPKETLSHLSKEDDVCVCCQKTLKQGRQEAQDQQPVVPRVLQYEHQHIALKKQSTKRNEEVAEYAKRSVVRMKEAKGKSRNRWPSRLLSLRASTSRSEPGKTESLTNKWPERDSWKEWLLNLHDKQEDKEKEGEGSRNNTGISKSQRQKRTELSFITHPAGSRVVGKNPEK